MKTNRKLRKELTWVAIIVEIILITYLLLMLSINLPITISIEEEFKYFAIVALTLILCFINYLIIKRFGNKKVLRSIIEDDYYKEARNG